ncbi:MFS transporter [Pseudomonas aeruginosa]|uniref:MFS transporter n=1 Tax=Pseudomonas aeruginosa TaxID=287 RepID=UPI0021F1810D|nr:MFS transporter [Pseudomonas aeruginosa]MCV6470532.1 MFS transporter [Pseudomonas aeruginosa]
MAQREFSATSGGVLLASVVAIMLGPTGILLNTFSLFIAPMSAEYAWDRAEVSLLVTLFGLAVAITSPLKGWLIDRWGARRTMLGLTAALSLPLLGLAAVNAVWQLYALFLLIGLLVGHQSLEAWGWRGAFLVYGVLELGLALPLLAWLFREPAPGAGVAAGTAVAETALSGSTAPQAWRSASFWLVLGNQVLAVFVMSGIMTHGVPMLVERGLSRGEAGTALSALWVGMMLSQPLMGWLLDRVATPRVALPFALAAVLGMAWFLVGDTPSGLWLAVFLVGLGGGGESGTTKYLLMRYFGLRSFGVIYGSIQPFTFALSISLGAYLLGWLYDRAEGYGTAEWVLLAAFSLAACSLFAFRPYPQKLP